MRYLKSLPHCFCWKQHGGQFTAAGLPDIICCIGGRFIAFEVKTATGKLTKLQESAIARINAAGGEAHKVTSIEDVIEIIKHYGGSL
jgi:hypothetical protein